MLETEQAIWNAYNLLLSGSDVERLRKLLVRYDLFRMTYEIPGDIVECGVFKGAGFMFWLKLLKIYCPGSAKRVIGFDTFSAFCSPTSPFESAQVEKFVDESQFNGITPAYLYQKIAAAGFEKGSCELVEGDIIRTASDYLSSRPGLRISLLHLDLDLEEGTFAALEAFWPRVVSGGLIIFDEYSVPCWTESNAVDRFFADKAIKLRTLTWSRTPTAFLVKE